MNINIFLFLSIFTLYFSMIFYSRYQINWKKLNKNLIQQKNSKPENNHKQKKAYKENDENNNQNKEILNKWKENTI